MYKYKEVQPKSLRERIVAAARRREQLQFAKEQQALAKANRKKTIEDLAFTLFSAVSFLILLAFGIAVLVYIQ